MIFVRKSVSFIINVLMCTNFLQSYRVEAQQACSIDGVSSISYVQQIAIDDTQIDSVIFQNATHGVTSITLQSILVQKNIIDEQTARDYFRTEFKDSYFTLNTTTAFANVHKDAYTNGSTLGIVINFLLTCESASQIATFTITITDTRRNKPRFLGNLYEYSVPMPIMPKSDFSVYGSTIEAEDINFSNTELNFEINPIDFDVISAQVTNKTFRATFRAIRLLQLEEDRSYTLTITDSGSNQNSTVIKISVNKSSGLDILKFSRSYYTFDYNASDTPDPLKKTSGDVEISTNKLKDLTDITLEGSYHEYFTAQLQSSTFDLALASNAVLPSDFNLITLTLSCKTDVAASTTLLISNVASDSKQRTVYFKNAYYTYIYQIKNKQPKLILNGPDNITLINMSSEDVTNLAVAKDYSSYFVPKLESDNSTITLALNEDNVLPSNIADVITVKLTCETSSTSATTDIVVSVVKTSSEESSDSFTENYYTFNYTDDGTYASLVPITGYITINASKTYDSSVLNIFGEYQEYFSYSLATDELQEGETTLISVSLKPKGILPNTAPYTIILTLSLLNTVNTSLIVYNNRNNAINPAVPKFDSRYYSAVYNPTTKSVRLDSDIKVTDVSSLTLLEDLPISSYFAIDKENSKYVVKVIKLLSDDVLNDTSTIVLTLVAQSKDGTAYCPLVISLPATSKGSDSTPSITKNGDVKYLVVVIVLAILLLLVISAVGIFWYFKLRNYKIEEDETEDLSKNKPTFAKNISVPKSNLKLDNVVRRPTGFVPGEDATFTKAINDYDYPTTTEIKNGAFRTGKKISFQNEDDDDDHDSGNDSMVPSRRATGFVFNPPPPEDLDEISVENPMYNANFDMLPKNERKSVAFDNSVEDNEYSGKSEKIASRRPTTFSFGSPLEDDLYADEDESSDVANASDDKEKKKAVVFDDRIVRMHVESNHMDDDESTLNEGKLI